MPITILRQAMPTRSGQAQWEVEHNGVRSFMTITQIKLFMGAK